MSELKQSYILFFSRCIKEGSILKPLYEIAIEISKNKHCYVQLCSHNYKNPPSSFEKLKDDIKTIVISSPEDMVYVEKLLPGRKLVYIEHGIGILKDHSSRPHNVRVDLNILPGNFWKERLLLKYPEEAKNVKLEVGGYVKTDTLINKKIDRVSMCQELKLDPNLPIILYAPTWSKGDIDLGMDCLKHFEGLKNVLALPHPADYTHQKKYTKTYTNIHIPTTQANITEYLLLGDIMVTDISSVGAEFAILKKPVIHIIHDIHKLDEARKEKWKHGLERYPDCTCDVTDDGYCIDNVTGELVDYYIPTHAEAIPQTVQKIIEEGVTDEYIQQQQTWVERIVEKPDGKTGVRIIHILDEYITTVT